MKILSIKNFFTFFSILLLALNCSAEEEKEALWEYGVGLGLFQYEQYPASKQSAYLLVPVPTFQYRGEHLRADDRQGARAFLLKEENFSLDFSGTIQPGMGADNNNQARQGMAPIPWQISLGPQLVWDLPKNHEFKLGIYPAVSTDFKFTQASGVLFDLRIVKKWRSLFPFWQNRQHVGQLAVSAQAASVEYLKNYFEVTPDVAAASRPAYDARAGFLSYKISLLEFIHSGKMTYFAGISYNNYDLSVNKTSPLHQSDHNFMSSVGISYRLGESEKSGTPEDEIEGIFNEENEP